MGKLKKKDGRKPQKNFMHDAQNRTVISLDHSSINSICHLAYFHHWLKQNDLNSETKIAC